jgi:hypothetical protein
MENPMVKIGATIAFPSLTREDQMSGKYSVQFANLSDAAAEKLDELGLNVKFKDDSYNRGRFIECKSKFPIDNTKYQTVLDEAGLPMDPDLLGPGSKVEALLKTYEWSMGGKSGVGARVVKIVVKELAKAETVANTADELEAL